MEITLDTNKGIVACYYDSIDDELFLFFDEDEEPWKGWHKFSNESFYEYVERKKLREVSSRNFIREGAQANYFLDWDDYLSDCHSDLEEYVRGILKKAGIIK